MIIIIIKCFFDVYIKVNLVVFELMPMLSFVSLIIYNFRIYIYKYYCNIFRRRQFLQYNA